MSRTYRHERMDDDGREIPDPTPMAPPVGYKRQPSLAEQIRQMVRSEQLAKDLAARGVETFDEADDFDIPDDPVDPSTPYEEQFDPVPVGELRRRRQAEKEVRRPGDEPEADEPADPPSRPAEPVKPAGEAPKARKRADIDD